MSIFSTQQQERVFFRDVTRDDLLSAQHINISQLPTLILPAARKKRKIETIYLGQKPTQEENISTRIDLPQAQMTQEFGASWPIIEEDHHK
ncbi:MAG: hypothetical protein H6728_00710 [Myxococcales bacterium]|nr:hypothetical protein [Myxococcales bacterium]MCB9641585.1 hypothetical protein [Myxococcales bacterium]